MKLPVFALIAAISLAACSTVPPNSQRLEGPGEWVVTQNGAVPVDPKSKDFSRTTVNPPNSEEIEWSHTLPKAEGNHWVVFRIKMNPSTGEIVDMDAAPTKDIMDCVNKTQQLSHDRIHDKKNQLPYAEARVCRQLAADGSPLDEDKIDEDGKVLPQDRGNPTEKKDNNTV